jgi:signal peptidase I
MTTNLEITTLREVWLQACEQHWLLVRGISMLPLLQDGDEVLISHDLSLLRRGEIVVFQKENCLVAHRVVRIKKEAGGGTTYLTKGDNTLQFDSPVGNTAILGRVISIRKNGQETRLNSPYQRFWNSVLAVYHSFTGILYQLLHSIKHIFEQKNS